MILITSDLLVIMSMKFIQNKSIVISGLGTIHQAVVYLIRLIIFTGIQIAHNFGTWITTGQVEE